MFKDQNSYTLSAVSVAALGAGAGVVLTGMMAGLTGGLATQASSHLLFSAVFLSAQLYLSAHVILAALDAVAPKAFLRAIAMPAQTPAAVVDVFIALDNPDDIELAAFSLAAAARLRYPDDRLRLHIVAAGQAANRCEPLMALAQAYGASWLPMSLTSTRERALAEAFDRTAGQLAIFLKPGEAPIADLLERVVGSFATDGMLGLAEIGHFLVDGDGARANTANLRRMPADCGPLARALLRGGPRPSPSSASTAVWRRGALISSGGFARSVIDGDMSARLTAVSRGWRRLSAPAPMIAVFAPRTVAAAVATQAAQRLSALDTIVQAGYAPFSHKHMNQIFRTLTLLTGALAPYATIALLAAPGLAILGGARLWGGPLANFASYAPLTILAIFCTGAAAQSGWRHSAASLFMDVATQLRLAGPMASLIAGGRPTLRGQAVVTPVFLSAISLAGLGFGAAKLAATPSLALGLAPLLLLCGISLVLALGALGAIHEPRQKRAAPRLPSDLEAELVTGTQRIPGRILDLSIQGARFQSDSAMTLETLAVGGLIRITGPHGPIQLPVQLSRSTAAKDRLEFGLRFTGRQLIAFAQAVTLVYRTQQRFAAARDARGRAPNGLMATMRTLSNGLRALLSMRKAAA